MARSPLYPHAPIHTLTCTPAPTRRVYDPATETYQGADAGEPVTFEVHARQVQVFGAIDRAGLDPARAVLECRVVGTPPGQPLRLPEGLTAGRTLPFTLRGKPGTATVLATPDAQHPRVAAKLGALFQVFWTSHE